LRLRPVEVRNPQEIETVLGSMPAADGDALFALPYALLFQQRRLLVRLAAQKRLPAVYPWREFVDEGGLVSYGANTADLYRRSGEYVDRILNGATPAELPVQQPIKFEVVVNVKTASQLGLTIPVLVLARADEVIE
jgi:putative ABC transport system substrate-binding protein